MAHTVFFVDRHDIGAFVELFHVEGSVEAKGQLHTGHDAIRTFMQSRDPARITRHVLGTPCILVDGSQARGVAYYCLYEGVESDTLPAIRLPTAVGEFHQDYRKDAQGWRVTSHRSIRIFQGHET